MSELLQAISKLRTGIAGFDHIAWGGLPEGRSTLVVGGTGTGKSLFAVEFLARGIEQFDEPGVFVTFEERPTDIRRNVASLGLDIAAWEADGKWVFIDATAAGGEDERIAGGYDFGGLLARIRHAVATIGAARLSFDSLGAVFSRFIDTTIVRPELLGVTAALRDMNVTSVLTAERDPGIDPASTYGVEEFVTDNVVVLRNVAEAEKRRRTVEILKLRGSPHRCGEWLFAISPEDGMVVLPVALMKKREKASVLRTTSGMSELDDMCGGGVFRDSVGLISGPTGVGKTIMATLFATGVAKGERSLLFSFEESRDQLVRNAASWGVDLNALEESGQLHLACQYPELGSLEDHFLAIQHGVEDLRPARLVVDSLSALQRVATTRGLHDLVIGLASLVKQYEVTTVFTTTTAGLLGGVSATEEHMSTLIDNIILLRYVERASEVQRCLTVLKMRGSSHDSRVREYTITGHGIDIGQSPSGVSGILGSDSAVHSSSSGPADGPVRQDDESS